MNDQPFSNYRYSAFVSYSTDDDRAWNSWVSSFADELSLALAPRLRGIRLPPIHLSGDSPLIQGRLSEKLCANVKASFAMFIFVHENYINSEWCMRELEYFASVFGDDGFRERLYLIAMSKPAIEELAERKQWRELFPFDDLVWLEFFRHDKNDRPIAIYPSNSRKRIVVADTFWDLFVEVREDLAQKIREADAKGRPAPAYPETRQATRQATDDPIVRVYIESNPDQGRYREALGRQLESSWERVVAAMKVEPRLYLRPTGVPMSEINQRPMLDDADGVVLQWGKKTPDSLAAQIQKVEPKLSGPNFAPGVIAYLQEGPNDAPHASSVNNWNVVRFVAGEGGEARVLPEDAAALESFLNSVLEHKCRR
jgi:hypothetical protein